MLHALSMKQNESNKHQIIGFWDGDLATPLSTLNIFMDVFVQRKQVEMVFGSRVALLGRDIQRHASRHYLGRIFATLASLLLRLRVYDTQCGAKLFRSSKNLKQALSEKFENSWIFDVELIARLQLQRERIRAAQKESKQPVLLPLSSTIFESPLDSWRDISGSKLSLKHKTSALYGLFHIWRRYTSPWKDWHPTLVDDDDDDDDSAAANDNDSKLYFLVFLLLVFLVTFVCAWLMKQFLSCVGCQCTLCSSRGSVKLEAVIVAEGDERKKKE